jgi:hypothetical protein
LRSALDDPSSDEEYIFATDFYTRKFGGRRTGIGTELLRSVKRLPSTRTIAAILKQA